MTILYAFQGGSDGANPVGSLAIGEGGIFYGATTTGGDPTTKCGRNMPGCGTVFSLAPPAATGGEWTHAVLFEFNGGNGYQPEAGVVVGAGGVLYGTTQGGGPGGPTACYGEVGCGTVFSLTPPASTGGPWTEAVLTDFTDGGPSGLFGGVVTRGGRDLRHHRLGRNLEWGHRVLFDGCDGRAPVNSSGGPAILNLGERLHLRIHRAPTCVVSKVRNIAVGV